MRNQVQCDMGTQQLRVRGYLGTQPLWKYCLRLLLWTLSVRSTSVSTTWSRSVAPIAAAASHTHKHTRTCTHAHATHTRANPLMHAHANSRAFWRGVSVCLFVCLLGLGRHRAAGGYAAATDARYRREPAGSLRDACCVTHAARCMLLVACCSLHAARCMLHALLVLQIYVACRLYMLPNVCLYIL
jgi:hypothetical protein